MTGGPSYIIIVTGERDWKDRETIYRVLDEELLEAFGFTPDDVAAKSFILRHGVCEGADWIANDWGKERGVTIERFHAKWNDSHGYNPAAGPIRNREMAASLPRANKCVAFWSGRMRKVGPREVSGTLGMMKQALQHYIPLRVEPPSVAGGA